MREKILVADDVVELAKVVKQILEYYDYDVDIAFDGKEALEKAKDIVYDCIILDVMMPVMDGIETLKQIRSMNIKTPVILLTAKDFVDDKVTGLDAGANDYLTKPFEQKELLARIRALTRINDENKKKYAIGNIIFDKEFLQISKDNVSLHLNNKECDLMEYLIKNQSRKVDVDELKQRIWINEINTENVIPIYIEYLQEKFTNLNANIKISEDGGYKIEVI